MLKDYKDYYDSKRLFPASLFIRVQINDSDYNVQPVWIWINDKKSAKFASIVFENSFGINSINKEEKPTMTSEDFSYMLHEKPGAYIWLGAGEKSEKLHSAHYDFNDELLPIGAEYWASLAEKTLE